MRKKTGKETQKTENYEFPTNRRELEQQLIEEKIEYFTLGNYNCFEHLGINANDILIVRASKHVEENQLALWRYAHTSDYNIAFHYDNFGDITLHNKAERCKRHKRREVILIGAVVGVIKPYDALSSNQATTASDETEVTLTCTECGKEITGDKKFLLAQGWECKGDETICLNCDLKKGF